VAYGSAAVSARSQPARRKADQAAGSAVAQVMRMTVSCRAATAHWSLLRASTDHLVEPVSRYGGAHWWLVMLKGSSSDVEMRPGVALVGTRKAPRS